MSYEKKIRKTDKKELNMKFFHCLFTPFFIKKNVLGLFFTATNLHIALSWSFPFMLPHPLICCPSH